MNAIAQQGVGRRPGTSKQTGRRIAIIGAGFSGSLLALHLLRRAAPEDRIYLVEKHRQFGRGLAYATGNANHLLNVRAGNMSAFPDEPDHFVRWLAALPPEDQAEFKAPAGPSGFAPRGLFGRYIQELLSSRIFGTAQCHNLILVNDEAAALHRTAQGPVLELAMGRRYDLDHAVLAIGNFPPAASTPGYFGDPWDNVALDALPPDAGILLLGTGLTAIDTIISLLDRGHHGPIHALSRRGLLPRQHLAAGYAPLPAPWIYTSPPQSGRLVLLLRAVRQAAEAATAEGRDWRAAIDGLRPHTQRLWQEMPLGERARFLRHLRPWWDVHRHRAAPQVMERILAAEADGQLRVIRGRLRAQERRGDVTQATIALRADSGEQVLTVDRIIDCSGPRVDITRVDTPLVRHLLGTGQARPDSLNLGLDVADDGRVIDVAGGASPDLYAIGPITKGAFWEIIAVPDLRNACAALASRLL